MHALSRAAPKAHEHWDPLHHTKAFGLVSLCIAKRWSLSWQDLFVSPQETGMHNAPLPIVDAPIPDGPGSSNDPKRPSGTQGSQAKDTAEAKSRLQALRDRTVNTLHAATRLMCDRALLQDSRIMFLVLRAGQQEYRKLCEDLKGPESVRQRFLAWARGEWIEDLKKVFDNCNDMGALRRCGFVSSFGSADLKGKEIGSAAVVFQDHLAGAMLRLTLEWLSQRPISAANIVELPVGFWYSAPRGL